MIEGFCNGNHRQARPRQRLTGVRAVLGLALAAGLAAGLPGCGVDSFVDPSVTGRWENTPTVMPILDRLSAIEDDTGEFVQTSPPQAADLVPEAAQYRFGPGDTLEVRIRDFFVIGIEEPFERPVDSRGFIDLPRLPPIRASGKTLSELVTAIEDAVRAQRINDRAVVSINIKSQRKQTFSVLGTSRNPGTYFIAAPDYRLLEGITAAGGIDESTPFVFVIRQVSLTDEAAGIVPAPEPTGIPAPGRPRANPAPSTDPALKRNDDLIELIDELSKQPQSGEAKSGDAPATDKPMIDIPSSDAPKSDKPAAPPNPSMMNRAEMGQPARVDTRVDTRPPAIDLPDSTSSGSGTSTPGSSTRSGWVYVDGKWIKSGGLGETADGGASNSPKRQVTQRVIKVPTGPLLDGAAEVNIVIRPGDVIRIPAPKSGLVYVAGQVARPGPYNLPAQGRLTLLRALDSAGGLNSIAIPERIDITRVLGEGRQATMRLNGRAIAEQTQPDIYLKPDDRINVGTNFFATPLAVLRGGFRASYGFGFILDRNFAENVFGPLRGTIGN